MMMIIVSLFLYIYIYNYDDYSLEIAKLGRIFYVFFFFLQRRIFYVTLHVFSIVKSIFEDFFLMKFRDVYTQFFWVFKSIFDNFFL